MTGPPAGQGVDTVGGSFAGRLVIGDGVTSALPAIVTGRVLVFGTRRALAEAGVRALLAANRPVFFTAISPNPTVRTVLDAAAAVDATTPDVVVGIGGGSTLDVAKAARVLPADLAAIRAALRGDGSALRSDTARLVLVPTTAGSGSEVTRFATVYDGARKYSLDFDKVRAEVALVDPERTTTCPPEVTYPAAFDAFAHAVESLWSRRATPGSARLAAAALAELARLTGEHLHTPSPRQRHRLAHAAARAGQAIDLTRTTAAHAFSYWLTSEHGIPHGTACALNLVWLSAYNTTHATDSERPRLRAVHAVLGDRPQHAIADRLVRAGISPRLRDHGLRAADIDTFVDAGLGNPSRADHNPVALRRDAVREEVVRHY